MQSILKNIITFSLKIPPFYHYTVHRHVPQGWREEGFKKRREQVGRTLIFALLKISNTY